jgi:thiopeptide-type bacteriocin biosynthesis protein
MQTVIIRVPFCAFNKPHINSEQLFFSSKDLLNATSTAKTNLARYKYLSRSATRPTPFGLLAGIGCVSINEATQIELPRYGKYKKFVRLDMDYLYSLVKALERIPDIRKQLVFYVNTSLYKTKKEYQYIECYGTGDKKKHKQCSIQRTRFIDKIINQAASGVNINDLINCISNEKISTFEAATFIDEIIESQILVSNLEPSLTSQDIFGDLIKKISSIKKFSLDKLIELLKSIHDKIEIINQTEIGVSIEVYENLISQIDILGVPYNKSKIFQVDMYIPDIKGGISRKNIEKIKRAIELLRCFSEYEDPLQETKEKFKRIFEGEEIPLSLMFDADKGIHFSENNGFSPLIDNLHVVAKNNNKFLKETDKDIYLTFLLKKAIANGEKVISLTENDIPEGVQKSKLTEPLPPSFSAMFRIVKEKGVSKIFIESISGNSAVDLLGRFGYLNENIDRHIKTIVKKETEIMKNCIVADLIHLPDYSIGNVLARNVLHEYQIPFLSNKQVAKEFEIPISDLVVSLQDNHFILRSKKQKKIVVPRLNNAHNYSNPLSLPLYNFLCDMQNQNTLKSLSFSWGDTMSFFNFFPRIEFENMILRLAEWRFTSPELKFITKTNLNADIEAFRLLINEWRSRYNIPDVFLLCEGDNELYIDVNTDIALEVFLCEIKSKRIICIKEFLMTEDNDTVIGEEGCYAQQFILSLFNESYTIPSYHFSKNGLAHKKFIAGSEWLYYKIYCGVKTADNILKCEIKKVTDELIKRKLIDKWFFIRYQDTDHHIRIRLHVHDISALPIVVEELYVVFNRLVQSQTISKILLDTYSREIERYGKKSIELSETLFYYDSVAILSFLNSFEGDYREEIRWLFALKYVDAFLNSFEFTLAQKVELTKRQKDSFSGEFNFQKAQREYVKSTYREKKEQINNVLRSIDKCDKLYLIERIMIEYKLNTEIICKSILSLEKRNNLGVSFSNFIASHIHMILNRLFHSRQRLNEALVYSLLDKHYSEIQTKVALGLYHGS